MRDSMRSQADVFAVAFESSASYFVTNVVAGVVSEHRSSGGDCHHFPQVELTLFCKEAGGEEDGLTRYGYAGVLEHNPEKHNPITILFEVGEEPGKHLTANCITPAFEHRINRRRH